MNAFDLLSELYRLLGQLDEQTLAAASRIAPSPEIRRIITALIQARSSVTTAVPPQGGQSGPSEADGQTRMALSNSQVDEERQKLVRYLATVTSNMSGQQVVDLFQHAGLKVTARDKESRSRIVRRAATMLQDLPDEKKLRILNTLKTSQETDQTAGWMEIIRSSTPR